MVEMVADPPPDAPRPHWSRSLPQDLAPPRAAFALSTFFVLGLRGLMIVVNGPLTLTSVERTIR